MRKMKSRIYNMGTILLVCIKVSNTCQLGKYQQSKCNNLNITERI